MPFVNGVAPGADIQPDKAKHIDKAKFRQILVNELNDYYQPKTSEAKVDLDLKRSLNIKYIN